MTVFDRIKKLSNKKGKSLQAVAEENNFSPNLFYRWKKSDPKGKDLAKVADYFNTTTDYLLGQEYGGDSPVPDEFQTMVDSLAEGYFKAHPELRKKNDD